MSNQIFIFLLNIVIGFFSLALLLRFYFQLFRLPYRHPVSQFLVAVTGFMVRPVRRVVPSWRGADLSSLLLAWLLECVILFGTFMLRGYDFGVNIGASLPGILLLGMVEVVKMSLYVVLVSVVLQAILSWVNPHSPLAPLLDGLTRPFLNVFRNRIPPVANVDLSPLFVIIVVQVLLMVVTEVHNEIAMVL
ncbi:MAG TPA: YggT family protein [Nitrosomonas sp.]|nr:YggT family protein [Nitrosomonas sp.]HQX12616.1 YggT family protein [Nitrosomonas sp.]HRB20606.1 YggT family protein [Nitrosomonas sp.]HRB32224.1 YggT family protein [Nitrosomonas sp.]HRB44886.1 YggT family protein [Nitrosomonas sp.]